MTQNIVELLEQTAIWRGQDGRVFYVGELYDGHIGNVIVYLNRHADELLEHRRRDADVDVVDALDWLHDRPLYRRLLAEQRRRATARQRHDEAMTKIHDEYGDALRRLGEL